MYANDDILIRPIRESDASLILEWENNVENWSVSGTSTRYTLGEILQLIDSLKDIEACKQARYLIVEKISNLAIGTIDLYDIDFNNEEAWIGVLVANPEKRNKGAASISIQKISELCVEELGIYQLYAKVGKDNLASVKLFETAGFKKKNLIGETELNNGDYIDSVIFNKWLEK